MPVTLRDGRDQIHLCWWWEDCDCAEGEQSEDLQKSVTRSAIRHQLNRYSGDAFTIARIRNLLHDRYPTSGVMRWGDKRVLDEAARLVELGTLRLTRCRSRARGGAGSGAGASEVDAQGRPRTPFANVATISDQQSSRESSSGVEKTWIEVRLINQDGEPVAGAKYRMTLTDGSVHEGALDSAGRVRFEDIDPGTCTVRFPEFHDKEWRPA